MVIVSVGLFLTSAILASAGGVITGVIIQPHSLKIHNMLPVKIAKLHKQDRNKLHKKRWRSYWSKYWNKVIDALLSKDSTELIHSKTKHNRESLQRPKLEQWDIKEGEWKEKLGLLSKSTPEHIDILVKKEEEQIENTKSIGWQKKPVHSITDIKTREIRSMDKRKKLCNLKMTSISEEDLAKNMQLTIEEVPTDIIYNKQSTSKDAKKTDFKVMDEWESKVDLHYRRSKLQMSPTEQIEISNKNDLLQISQLPSESVMERNVELRDNFVRLITGKNGKMLHKTDSSELESRESKKENNAISIHEERLDFGIENQTEVVISQNLMPTKQREGKGIGARLGANRNGQVPIHALSLPNSIATGKAKTEDTGKSCDNISMLLGPEKGISAPPWRTSLSKQIEVGYENKFTQFPTGRTQSHEDLRRSVKERMSQKITKLLIDSIRPDKQISKDEMPSREEKIYSKNFFQFVQPVLPKESKYDSQHVRINAHRFKVDTPTKKNLAHRLKKDKPITLKIAAKSKAPNNNKHRRRRKWGKNKDETHSRLPPKIVENRLTNEKDSTWQIKPDSINLHQFSHAAMFKMIGKPKQSRVIATQTHEEKLHGFTLARTESSQIQTIHSQTSAEAASQRDIKQHHKQQNTSSNVPKSQLQWYEVDASSQTPQTFMNRSNKEKYTEMYIPEEGKRLGQLSGVTTSKIRQNNFLTVSNNEVTKQKTHLKNDIDKIKRLYSEQSIPRIVENTLGLSNQRIVKSKSSDIMTLVEKSIPKHILYSLENLPKKLPDEHPSAQQSSEQRIQNLKAKENETAAELERKETATAIIKQPDDSILVSDNKVREKEMHLKSDIAEREKLYLEQSIPRIVKDVLSNLEIINSKPGDRMMLVLPENVSDEHRSAQHRSQQKAQYFDTKEKSPSKLESKEEPNKFSKVSKDLLEDPFITIVNTKNKSNSVTTETITGTDVSDVCQYNVTEAREIQKAATDMHNIGIQEEPVIIVERGQQINGILEYEKNKPQDRPSVGDVPITGARQVKNDDTNHLEIGTAKSIGISNAQNGLKYNKLYMELPALQAEYAANILSEINAKQGERYASMGNGVENDYKMTTNILQENAVSEFAYTESGNAEIAISAGEEISFQDNTANKEDGASDKQKECVPGDHLDDKNDNITNSASEFLMGEENIAKTNQFTLTETYSSINGPLDREYASPDETSSSDANASMSSQYISSDLRGNMCRDRGDSSSIDTLATENIATRPLKHRRKYQEHRTSSDSGDFTINPERWRSINESYLHKFKDKSPIEQFYGKPKTKAVHSPKYILNKRNNGEGHQVQRHRDTKKRDNDKNMKTQTENEQQHHMPKHRIQDRLEKLNKPNINRKSQETRKKHIKHKNMHYI